MTRTRLEEIPQSVGVRFRSQILTFLFLLFGTSILMVTYFNVSILSQSVRSEAEQEAGDTATRVALWFEQAAARRGQYRSFADFTRGERARLHNYLDRYPELRGVELFDQGFSRVYGYHIESTPPREILEATLRRGETVHKLWYYRSASDRQGRPLTDLNPFSRGFFTLEQYSPLVLAGETDRAVLHVSVHLPFLPQRLRLITLGNALLGLLFLVVAWIAVSIWGEHAITRPFRNLLAAQERLARGDYTAQVDLDIPTTDELVALSNSFNRMARRLAAYQGELWDKTRRLEQLNERYRALNEHLEQQVEEKTRELREFFSLVTHDLRIPLAAIRGYTELLSRGDLGERQRRYLDNMRVANSHCLELVRNLLEAFRFDAGQVQLAPEAFELRPLVEEVVGQLSPPEEGIEPRVQVEVPAGCGLVYADRHRIGRVLTNLLGNALRFSPPDRPPVLWARDRGKEVEVEVRDYGPGIPEEHLPKLFQKFTQFPSRDGPSSGVGLGLYIVGRILESHGRKIHVESAAGEGTRFWFTLPRPVGVAVVEREPVREVR